MAIDHWLFEVGAFHQKLLRQFVSHFKRQNVSFSASEYLPSLELHYWNETCIANTMLECLHMHMCAREVHNLIAGDITQFAQDCYFFRFSEIYFPQTKITDRLSGASLERYWLRAIVKSRRAAKNRKSFSPLPSPPHHPWQSKKGWK